MTGFTVATIPLLILWLVLAPMLAGTLIIRILPERDRTLGMCYLTGLLTMFAVFEPISVYCMIRIPFETFSICIRMTMAAYSLLFAVSIVFLIRTAFLCKKRGEPLLSAVFTGYRPREVASIMHPRRELPRINKKLTHSEKLYLTSFGILLLVQLFLAVFMAPFDGDDAYYVVQSVQAQQTDTMYTLHPYLGYSMGLDVRHALAAWPMWIALIARLSGLHATIVAHTVLPLILIPLCYYVYCRCARQVLRERTDLVLLFLTFLSLFYIFGNISIYTPETFFLMRTWQGKAMTANLVIPMLFTALLMLAGQEVGEAWRLCSRRERVFPWVLFLFADIAAAFFSTSGMLILTMLAGLGVFVILTATFRKQAGADEWKHRIKLVILTGLCCSPAVLLALVGRLVRV